MKNLRRLGGILVLAVTLLAFAYYWHNHPGLLDQLRLTSISALLIIVALYTAMLGSLIFIYSVALKICRAEVPYKQNILLSMYSSIVNFFGPLQSGPGFRLVYLKKKYGVSAKAYGTTMLIYYAMFAFISGLFVIAPNRPWWQVLLALLVLAAIMYLFYKLVWRNKIKNLNLLMQTNFLAKMALGTMIQLVLVAAIYYTELKQIDSHISISQAITYTGAANFALFVSLTPGALGFRESFLYFTQSLHHISNFTILAANVIDRGIYLLFLLLLFVVILSVHAKDRLDLSQDSAKDRPAA